VAHLAPVSVSRELNLIKEECMPRIDTRARVAALVLVAVAAAAGVGAVSHGATLRSAGGTAGPATGACKPSGTLTYGLAGGGIETLDPAASDLAARTVIMPLLFPALTAMTADGTVRPDLATKWKVSPDGKTWWFYLRHDVRYANGRPFTSADVVANILHDLIPATGALARQYIDDIRSVDAIGKYEVRFKTGSPRETLPDALYLAKMADLSNPATVASSGNGTGPYKVAAYTPNESLTLVPNPYYYGPQPCIKKIVFLAQPDTTSMVTQFTSGHLGMIWQFPVSALSTIKQDKNANIIVPSTVSTPHVLLLDTTSPPFNNLLAREALSYAVDRPAMVKVSFLGQAQASVANDPLSRTSPFYDKALTPQTFNLTKAQQLFQEAGVPAGTTFTYWAQSGKRPEWITDAEILQSDLQKIGYNLNIVQSDPATWLGRFNPWGKTYPGLIVASYLSMQPNPILGLSSALQGCDCNWGNIPGTEYPKYFSLVQQANATTDPTKLQTILDQLQVLFQQQVPYIVLAHQTNLSAVQKNVEGVWEDPSGNVHLENARIVN
jgi:peptide/nickel transport system substrate-binding protein